MTGGFFDISEAGAKRKLLKSARIRVSVLLLILCIAASLQSFILLGAVAFMVLCLCLWVQIKWTYVFLRMLFLVPFGLGAILLLPFTIEGEQIELIWSLSVSDKGIDIALLLVCKLLVCHFIICLLLATTSPSELFNALRKIGMPFVLVEIMKLTLRYLSVLFEEIERMMTAQQSRGFTFKSFASWSSYKRSGELLGVLLIRSYHRSQRVHEAMLARGFTGEEKEK